MGFLDSLFGTPRESNVIVTDVTRMQGRKVCVAALQGQRAVRLHNPHPDEGWLDSVGGLRPGDALSVTWRPAKRYAPPHSEDCDWNPRSARKLDPLSETDLVARLTPIAHPTVEKAFGEPAFFSPRGNPAFKPNRGSRSLASLVVRSISVYPQGDGIRADFSDSVRDWTGVPVEDLAIRRHQATCAECATNLAETLFSEFSGDDAVLRIGLGRKFETEGRNAGCYLQVNHIFRAPSRRNHFRLA